MMNYKSTLHRHYLRLCYITLCLLILFISCKNKKAKVFIKDPSPYFSNFFSEKQGGILRDIEFKMLAQQVKKTEESKLYESSTDHLFYEFTYPKDSTSFSEYANVHYYFDENNKLDIITADIYLNDSIQERQLKDNIIEYYTLQYGNPETDDYGYSTWKAIGKDKNSEKEFTYSIGLKKQKEDFGVALEYLKQ